MWTWGAHDNTPAGWVLTGLYGIAGALSWACALTASRPREGVKTASAVYPACAFWAVAGVALLALGANKQFDFQTALVRWGRSALIRLGEYRYRTWIELAVVAALSVAAVVTLCAGWRIARAQGPAYQLSLLGWGLLAAFIVLRAIPFPKIAPQWAPSPWLRNRMEAAALMIIIAGALWALARIQTAGRPVSQPHGERKSL